MMFLLCYIMPSHQPRPVYYVLIDDYNSLPQTLLGQLDALCKNSILVEKQVVLEDGTLINEGDLVAGWEFKASDPNPSADLRLLDHQGQPTTEFTDVTLGNGFSSHPYEFIGTNPDATGTVRIAELSSKGPGWELHLQDKQPVVCTEWGSEDLIPVQVETAADGELVAFNVEARLDRTIHCVVQNTPKIAAPAIEIIKKINGDDANISPGVLIPSGQEAIVTFDVFNAGNTILNDIVVTDDKIASENISCNGGSNTIAELAAGATAQCTAKLAPLAANSTHTNIATVTAKPPAVDGNIPPALTDSDPANAYTKESKFEVRKFAKTPTATKETAADGTIRYVSDYEARVVNVGSIDGVHGRIIDIPEIPAGFKLEGVWVNGAPASVEQNGAYLISDPAPLTAYDFLRIFNVTVKYSPLNPTDEQWAAVTGVCQDTTDGTPSANGFANLVTLENEVPGKLADNDACVNIVEDPIPGVSIVKKINGQDANDTAVEVPVGSDMVVTFEVTNTGDAPLDPVTVTDNVIPSNMIVPPNQKLKTDGSWAAWNGTLLPGEFAVFTAVWKAPAVGEQHVNVGTADVTVPPTTIPGTTAPATTRPEVTVSESTIPGTTVPGTTDATTTFPGATVPPITVPASTIPGSTIPGTTRPEVVVTPTTLKTSDPATATVTTPPTPGVAKLEIEKQIDGNDADVAPGVELKPGDPMTITYKVVNSGAVKVFGITITDTVKTGDDVQALQDQISAELAKIQAFDLAPGEAKTVTISVTAPAAKDGHLNVAKASGKPEDPNNPGNPDPKAPPVESPEDPGNGYNPYNPSIQVMKKINGDDANTKPGVEVKLGEPMNITYDVTNTGDVKLTDIKLVDTIFRAAGDEILTVSCPATELEAGAMITCTTQYPAPEQGVGHFDLAKVEGTPPTIPGGQTPPPPVTDEDPGFAHIPSDPSVQIIKKINGNDANVAPGAIVKVGEQMNVTFEVTNTGKTELIDVTVTDDTIAASAIDCGDGTNVVAKLAGGTSATCTVTFAAPAEGEQHTNIGKVVATPATDVYPTTTPKPGTTIPETTILGTTVPETVVPGTTNATTTVPGSPVPGTTVPDKVVPGTTIPGEPEPTTTPVNPPAVKDHDPANAVVPAVTIIKKINGDDADTAPGVTVKAGEKMNITYEVTNTGLAPLKGVKVTDNVPVQDLSCPETELAPGAFMVCTATLVAPAAGVQHTNIGTVEGTPVNPDGTPAKDKDGNDFPPVKSENPANAMPTDEPLGSIGDFVWEDLNENGIQDTGEPGVPGVTVTLTKPDGTTVTTVTDATGEYKFPDLPAGDYTVTFTVPDGFTLTPTNVGTPDKDSNGLKSTVTLTPGGSDTAVDFGLVKPKNPGAIGNFVWEDLNENGIQDSGEPGIPNVTVKLINANGVQIDEQVTNVAGEYLFKDVPAGTYTVIFTEPEGYFTTTTVVGGDRAVDSNGLISLVIVEPGVTDTTIDLGLVKPKNPGGIGDFVWEDINKNGIQDPLEPGIFGTRVDLVDLNGIVVTTTTTDANGKYEFTNVVPGEYRVIFTVPEGYTLTTTNAGNDPAKDSNGLATLVTVKPGVTDTTVDLGLVKPENPGSIGDFVWEDNNADGIQGADEPGIPGVTVILLDKDGNPIDRVVTNGNGNYTFKDVPAGDYTVKFVLPDGYTVTKTNVGDPSKDSNGLISTVTVKPGESNTTVDLGLIKPANPGAIGDFVWEDLNHNGIQDPGESGIPLVTVTLTDKAGNVIDQVRTDATGHYIFNDVPAGDYNVIFTLPAGYAVTKTNVGDAGTDSNGLVSAVTVVAGQTDTTIDLGLFAPENPATIGDFVWEDSNENGIQDDKEKGIPGVRVILKDAADNIVGIVTTDKDGHYEFTVVVPGDYTVEFELPEGYEETTTGVGTADKDSNGRVSKVTVKAGEVNKTIDLGLKKPKPGTPGIPPWLPLIPLIPLIPGVIPGGSSGSSEPPTPVPPAPVPPAPVPPAPTTQPNDGVDALNKKPKGSVLAVTGANVLGLSLVALLVLAAGVFLVGRRKS